jgi:hypothetical protein
LLGNADMRTSLLRWTVAGMSLVGLAVGCSSSPAPNTSTVAPPSFSGIYVTHSAGGIQQFEFVDASHVNVWWAACANGEPCVANDTYTMKGDELVIDEPGGNSTKIILSGIETGPGTLYDPLHPAGISLSGGGGDSGISLSTTVSINANDAGTITLVISFTITIVLAGGGDGGIALTGDGSVGDANAGGSDASSGNDAIALTNPDAGNGNSGSGSGSNGSGSGSNGSGSGSNASSGSGGGGPDAGGGGMDAGSGSGSSPMVCSNVTPSQTFHSSNTFPNDKTAFDFFLGKNLTATQAAGIVGNLDQESGNSPTCYQGPQGCSSTPVSGYPGAGIAQWSIGGRWNTGSSDNATAYAQMQGTSLFSEQTQLNFLWYELSTFSRYGLSSLQSSTSIDSATQVFMADFEICGTCAQSSRDKYAQNAYNAFSSDAPQGGGMDAGSCIPNYGSCSVNGSSGSCIDTGSCSSSGGTSTAGKCPGPSNIQCCTQ